MCVFFFFKQKTANEMRISDWSSDVCSSDLFRRDYGSRRSVLQLHASDRIAFANVRGLLTLGIKALAIDYRQRGHGDVDAYALADGTPGFGPIGRESCRGRVCRYV